MSDVANTLIGAAVGFGLGLVAQPITHELTKWLKQRDVRGALYTDLGLVYHLLSRVTDLSPEGKRAVTETETEERSRAIQIFDSIDVEAYKHYSTGQAAIFWSLSEASAFKRLYESLGAGIGERTAGRDSWETTQGYITRWFTAIERHFQEGTIDSKKLLTKRAKARDKTFKRVTAYYTSDKGPAVRDNRP
jgi:hypothetical protein